MYERIVGDVLLILTTLMLVANIVVSGFYRWRMRRLNKKTAEVETWRDELAKYAERQRLADVGMEQALNRLWAEVGQGDEAAFRQHCRATLEEYGLTTARKARTTMCDDMRAIFHRSEIEVPPIPESVKALGVPPERMAEQLARAFGEAILDRARQFAAEGK